MAALGLGIIGCGNISSRYFGNAARFPGIEVRACADLVEEAAKRSAEEYGVRCETVDGILRSDDVQLIVNLTIPDAHYDVCAAALQAGKHVYTEKPLAATSSQARKLIDLAGRSGLRLGCAPDTFLGAAGQTARLAVDEGRIGRIVGGACHLMSHGAEAWHPNPDFLYRLGAGPMLDMGPYYVTMLVNLIGPVSRVSALMATPFATRTIGSGPRAGDAIAVETPTTIHSMLEFESGTLVTFSASWDVWRHGHNNMEIYGETGSMVVPDPNFFGGQVQVSFKDGDYADIDDEGHAFGRENRQARRGVVADYRIAGIADMAAAIAENRPHRCDAALGLHVLEVLEGILLSAKESRVVPIATRCVRPEPLAAPEAAELLGEGDTATDEAAKAAV